MNPITRLRNSNRTRLRYPCRILVSPALLPRHAPPFRLFTTLGIETSCDDTAVAILKVASDWPPTQTHTTAKLLFNTRHTADLTQYRGIHPAAAAESHRQWLDRLITRSLIDGLPESKPEDGIAVHCPETKTTQWRRKPDLIAVTQGPGMAASLQVGLIAAERLAAEWEIPVVGTHHMLAHAWTPALCHALGLADPGSRLIESPSSFPSYSLLVSGGHTQLLFSTSAADHQVVTDTIDVAVGDALDKIARLILPARVIDECGHTSYGALLEPFAFPDRVFVDAKVGSDRMDQPDKYLDIYTPSSPCQTRKRRTDPTWGWSFRLPFAEKSRAEIAASLERALVRIDRRKAADEHNLDCPPALPFAFSSIMTSVRLFTMPDIRRNWSNERNKFILSPRHPASPDDPISIEERRALARAVLTITFESIAEVVIDAVQLHQQRLAPSHPIDCATIPLIVAGGVSANTYLRHVLHRYLDSRVSADGDVRNPNEQKAPPHGQSKLPVRLQVIPTPTRHLVARQLCTDNAAMIAWAGMWMHQLKIGPKLVTTRGGSDKPQESVESRSEKSKIGTIPRWSLGDLEKSDR